MKRRVMSMVAVLLLALSITANAAEWALRPRVSLSFSGTTANCTATVASEGDRIVAVMVLKEGSLVLDSWSGSGVDSVLLKGNCPVEEGGTYTLTVSGTLNGVPFSDVTVTGTC